MEQLQSQSQRGAAAVSISAYEAQKLLLEERRTAGGSLQVCATLSSRGVVHSRCNCVDRRRVAAACLAAHPPPPPPTRRRVQHVAAGAPGVCEAAPAGPWHGPSAGLLRAPRHIQAAALPLCVGKDPPLRPCTQAARAHQTGRTQTPMRADTGKLEKWGIVDDPEDDAMGGMLPAVSVSRGRRTRGLHSQACALPCSVLAGRGSSCHPLPLSVPPCSQSMMRTMQTQQFYFGRETPGGPGGRVG